MTIQTGLPPHGPLIDALSRALVLAREHLPALPVRVGVTDSRVTICFLDKPEANLTSRVAAVANLASLLKLGTPVEALGVYTAGSPLWTVYTPVAVTR